MTQELCPQHAKNESQINDLRVKQEQHDAELRKIFELIASIEAKVMLMISEFGLYEKNIIARVEKIEEEQVFQRVEDTKRDKETAVATTKMNLIWEWFWSKNGFALIAILAYAVLGR